MMEVSWETITSQNSIITSHVNEIVFDDDNTAYIGTIDGLFKMIMMTFQLY